MARKNRAVEVVALDVDRVGVCDDAAVYKYRDHDEPRV